jgi:hypothetical protein
MVWSWKRPRLLGLGALACAVTLLATCGSAAATCLNSVYDEPLPITSATPANGASIPQSGSQRVPFTLVSTAQHMSLSVRVSSQNTLGQNGTLSDLHMLDFFALAESITDPGNYSGVSNVAPGWWTNYPGTYYWQLFGEQSYYDQATMSIVCHAYAGPVFTITVAAPPPPPVAAPPPTPPPITLSEARSYAAQMVHDRTGRRPRLGIGCSQINTWTLRCALSWKAGIYRYAAAGKFWHFLGSNGTPYWTYDFSGNRAWRTCTRHHRCRVHRQHFRWH